MEAKRSAENTNLKFSPMGGGTIDSEGIAERVREILERLKFTVAYWVHSAGPEATVRKLLSAYGIVI